MTSTLRQAAPPGRAWWAQARTELLLTLRNGESVLLTFLIPLILLTFFSTVDVLPTGEDDPVDFLFPGVLALAIMSTSMVSVAISTGFERQSGVLKRLGSTPLTRGQLLAAKTTAMVVLEVMQVGLITVTALALGFRFDGPQVGAAVGGAALATVAFAGLGLLMAGTLKALTTLALANGVYLVLMLLSGMVIPLDQLPAPIRGFARALPSGALAEVLHGSIGGGGAPGQAWAVLGAWALVAPLVAARLFRWE
jgi:ABC-2 type transport system permease protein